MKHSLSILLLTLLLAGSVGSPTIQAQPYVHHFDFRMGDALSMEGEYKDVSAAGMETGRVWTTEVLHFTVYDPVGTETFTKNSTDDPTIVVLTDGFYAIKIDESDTALTSLDADSTYWYEIDEIDTNGLRHTRVMGQMYTRSRGNFPVAGQSSGMAILLGTGGVHVTFNTAGPGNRGIPAGGTTSEVLSKTSGTDYDVEWASFAAVVPDGDKGDITASSSGTVWTIDVGVVTNAKLANSAVNYGGISVALGASDLTPAFNLVDATGYPASALTGTLADLNTALSTGLVTGAHFTPSTLATDYSITGTADATTFVRGDGVYAVPAYTTDTDFASSTTHEQIPFDRSDSPAGTDSLRWDGSAGSLLATRVLAGDGTELLPAISFQSDPDEGFFYNGNGSIGISVLGDHKASLTHSGGGFSIRMQSSGRLEWATTTDPDAAFDVILYRPSSGLLRVFSGALAVDEGLTVGTPANTTDEYAQIDAESGAPPAADCDNDSERGRMILDYSGAAGAHKLWICVSAADGWDSVTLTD